MAIKEMASLTPEVIFGRICDIALRGKVPMSARTCWNAVGVYLGTHRGTVGKILMYTQPGIGNYVAHVMLIDKNDRTLKDTLGGTRNAENTRYTRQDKQVYQLIAQYDWPPAG